MVTPSSCPLTSLKISIFTLSKPTNPKHLRILKPPHQRFTSLISKTLKSLVVTNGAISVRVSTHNAKRSPLSMVSKSSRASSTIKSPFLVREEPTSLRFLTLRSSTPYLALIVAKRSARSGKSNLDKRSSERTLIINSSRRSCLSRPREKCRVIRAASLPIIIAGKMPSMGSLEEGRESLEAPMASVVVHLPRPHTSRARSIRAAISPIITSRCWRSRLIFRPKSWQSILLRKIKELVFVRKVKRSLLSISTPKHR